MNILSLEYTGSTVIIVNRYHGGSLNNDANSYFMTTLGDIARDAEWEESGLSSVQICNEPGKNDWGVPLKIWYGGHWSRLGLERRPVENCTVYGVTTSKHISVTNTNPNEFKPANFLENPPYKEKKETPTTSDLSDAKKMGAVFSRSKLIKLSDQNQPDGTSFFKLTVKHSDPEVITNLHNDESDIIKTTKINNSKIIFPRISGKTYLVKFAQGRMVLWQQYNLSMKEIECFWNTFWSNKINGTYRYTLYCRLNHKFR